MPQVNPEDYQSLSAILEDLKFKPTDRWSDVMGTEDYYRLYDRGEYIGHGFGLVDDPEGNLWVGFVYENSNAGTNGIERGWQILSINGVAVSPGMELDSLLGNDEVGVENTFQFRNRQGGTVVLTLRKDVVDIDAVLYSRVIDVGNIKVGYLVYQQFLLTSLEELDAVFSEFMENNVSEVIVDLRYNPGGQVDVAQYLASLIAGTKAVKGTFAKFLYNDKKSDRNISMPFLDLDYTLTTTPERVFFITTGRSASSSEVLINGMTPYIDAILVGDDTYGKPVGSIAATFPDSTLIPITFKLYNRLNEGDFFNGLEADAYIEEDIGIEFGQPDEKMLGEVLYYIQNDEWSGAGRKKSDRKYWPPMRGIRSRTGAI
jgi:C-terminal processing protease CtpA/Prc